MPRIDLVDFLSIDDGAKVHRTKDGYLVAVPRIARTGIQLYSGKEVGLKDKKVVRVYRPEEEVFHPDAVASLTHRPLTNDHPPEPVTADNWKKFATGQFGDEAIRDGDTLRVPMVMMDRKAIDDYEAGKRQLSVGYSCELEIKDGVVEDGPHKGQAYDAIQRTIRGNHIAQCKAARGGERLAIGDAGAEDFGKDADEARDIDLAIAGVIGQMAVRDGKVKHEEIKDSEATMDLADGYPFGKDGFVYAPLLKATRQRASDIGEDAIVKIADKLLSFIGDNHHQTEARMPKVLIIDGVSVEFVTDQSAQIAERAIADRDAKLTKLTSDHAAVVKDLTDKATTTATSIATLTSERDTLKGENAGLTQKLKDAEITPDKLNALVADREAVLVKAKAILGDKLDLKASNDEIRKAAVDLKLGDNAKGFSPESYAAAFVAITADTVTGTAVNDARLAFGQPHAAPLSAQTMADKVKMYDAADKKLSERWKGPQAA